MRSRVGSYSKSESDRRAREIAREELLKMRDEIYAYCERDCAYQAIATCLLVLHKHLGFGKTRLQRIKHLIEDEYKLMEDGILGKDYSPRDIQKWLKDEMEIDLDASQYQE